jgi:hypothetical protein
VLIVCTPRSKLRSDQRIGGVGYEGDIITGEVLVYGQRRKFIPILAEGAWEESAPTWLLGSLSVDLRDRSEAGYESLVRTIHQVPVDIPPLGVSWASEAAKAGNYRGNHHPEVHRGAILWFKNVVAIFGNERYETTADDGEAETEAVERTKNEVHILREQLLQHGIRELGCGTSSDGGTWVLVVATDTVREMHALVWTCYPPGASNNAIQQQEAFRRVWSYWTNPFMDAVVEF